MPPQNFPKEFLANPFFLNAGDPDWNACIGRQANEFNYIDGYIDAAVILVGNIIDQKLYDKRDTLVLPILYTARHGVELVLKFTINELQQMDVLKSEHPTNHDIKSHFDFLINSELGDRELREILFSLKPYVLGLARIDDDGQELRYHKNKAGKTSLEDETVANLIVIRFSLTKIKKLISRLTYRISDLRTERTTNSRTKECSRQDLITIAERLPGKALWTNALFTKIKTEIMKDYDLSNRKFSDALDIIKSNRTMKACYGESSSLGGLSDETVIFILESWLKRQAETPRGNGIGAEHFGQKSIEFILADQPLIKLYIEKLRNQLSVDDCADLETLFYYGREERFTESYEADMKKTRLRFAKARDPYVEAHRVLKKMNFGACFAAGIRHVGRSDLAMTMESTIANFNRDD